MERGGLQPTQIQFHVKVNPGATGGTVLPGNLADRKRMKAPFRHLSISYNIAIDNIAFDRSADGRYHADFEFGVMVYDSDGQLINTASKQVRPVLAAAAYESMLKDGAEAHQEIDVPAHGGCYLRIGVHDLTSDRVGALEVPTSTLANAAPDESVPKP
jgi:hypothetical protein